VRSEALGDVIGELSDAADVVIVHQQYLDGVGET
jgi:hypothetical protein